MKCRLAQLSVIGLAACGGGAAGDPDAPPVIDTSPPPDAALPDAAPCPSIDMCGWLLDYQQDILGRLTGEREITPGVTITRRASMAERTTVRQFLFDELARLGYTPELHAYSASGGNVLATLPANPHPNRSARNPPLDIPDAISGTVNQRFLNYSPKFLSASAIRLT